MRKANPRDTEVTEKKPSARRQCGEMWEAGKAGNEPRESGNQEFRISWKGGRFLVTEDAEGQPEGTEAGLGKLPCFPSVPWATWNAQRGSGRWVFVFRRVRRQPNIQRPDPLED